MSRGKILDLCLAVFLSALLAGTMALIDWLENPGGIFHGPDGTRWDFVLETAWSWFLPGLLVAMPLVLLTQLLLRRLRRS